MKRICSNLIDLQWFAEDGQPTSGEQPTVSGVAHTVAEPTAEFWTKPANAVDEQVNAQPLVDDVQMTEDSEPFSFEGNPTIGLHQFNLPHVDKLWFVRQVRDWIIQKAEAFEQENHVAYFLIHKSLIVKKLDATAEERVGYNDSEWLMAHRDELAVRLALKAYHYYTGVLNAQAARANVIMLTRFNGKDNVHMIATAVKPSFVKGNLDDISPFLGIAGWEDSLNKYFGFAYGRNALGSAIVSIPWLRTSVYGNAGQTAPSLDSLFAQGADGAVKLFEPPTDDSSTDYEDSEEKAIADNLINMIDRTLTEHGRGTRFFDTRAATTPQDPIYENGYTIGIQGGTSSLMAVATLNKMGQHNQLDVPEFKPASKTSLTAIAVNNYYYWVDYLTTFFPELQAEGHYMRTFFAELEVGGVKVFAPQRNIEDMMTLIQKIGSFDLDDLASHMIYKKDNKINSATIVKYSPLVLSGGPYSGNAFDLNFGTFPTDWDDTKEQNDYARAFPGLTPAVFAGSLGNNIAKDVKDKLQPFVLNGLSTPGIGFDSGLDQDNSEFQMLPVGKGATLLDIACLTSKDNPLGKIRFQGVSKTFAEKFCSVNGYILQEDQNQPRLVVQPIIDNSDPYQCGFAVMITSKDRRPDEWSKFLRDPSMYQVGANDQPAEDYYEEVTNLPSSDVYVPSPNGATEVRVQRHVKNHYFVEGENTVFVFVGLGIKHHPLMITYNEQAGYPAQILFTGSAEVKTAFDAIFKSSAIAGGGSAAQWEVLRKWFHRAAIPGTWRKNVGGQITVTDITSAFDRIAAIYNAPEQDYTPQVIGYTFNPLYPPVIIGAYDMPMAGVHNVLPVMSDQTDGSIEKPGRGKAILPKLALSGLKAGKTTMSMALIRLAADNITNEPVERWLWFLNSFDIVKRYAKKWGATSMAETATLKVRVASWATSFFNLISRAVVSNSGKRRIISVIQFAKESYDAGYPTLKKAGTWIRELNLTNEPRIFRGQGHSAGRNYSKDEQEEVKTNVNNDKNGGSSKRSGKGYWQRKRAEWKAKAAERKASAAEAGKGGSASVDPDGAAGVDPASQSGNPAESTERSS